MCDYREHKIRPLVTVSLTDNVEKDSRVAAEIFDPDFLGMYEYASTNRGSRLLLLTVVGARGQPRRLWFINTAPTSASRIKATPPDHLLLGMCLMEAHFGTSG